jgi:hypothetical protein
MMWTLACYLFMWPLGQLKTVFPSRHVRSLPHPCTLFGVGAGIGVAGSVEYVGGDRHSGIRGSSG